MPPRRGPDRTPLFAILIVTVIVVLASIRGLCRWIIDLEWWTELGQKDTLMAMITYAYIPALAVTLLGFACFWMAHARGLKAAGTSLREHPTYSRLTSVALFVIAYLVTAATVDGWTVVRYFGAFGIDAGASGWQDPVFGKPLAFYLFEIPFYRLLLRVVLTFAMIGGLIHWIAERGWSLRRNAPEWMQSGQIDLADLRLSSALESRFLQVAAAIFLLTLAVSNFLDRYQYLTDDHVFMVGIDYVDEHIRLPLKMFTALGCVIGFGLVLMRRWGLMLVCLILPVALEAIVPRAIHALYVRPNEITMERPYVQRHIVATRSAFGLSQRSKEIEYNARITNKIDPARHKPLLDNVRLWDWRPFHDTVTQIQALRPYYVFADTDVDRYIIDGQLRQMMLTPREIDVKQLSADAQSRWVNPHFIYTHGYGVAMAEANQITPDGLPVLFIQDAPPQVRTPSLKLTRPEIYYGEVTHEPVFVRTAQPEFNYPSGSENVHSRYDGSGGFPISGLPMRFAAALAEGDWNIVLTTFLTPESRMMIRRNIRDRVSELADFMRWDPDPYLVLTDEGRLVWIIDGYTTSSAHPYSRGLRIGDNDRTFFNYIRNSVKATVDAYDGKVSFYIFDNSDPIIQAYARLFPKLFKPASEMPADVRTHARYPELLFRAQAEIYRTFHMRDPESFYNKEDAWDLARSLTSQDGKAAPFQPTYVVATLPGETAPEFLLLIPFTPRNKDNLIGFMAARCDGDKLGELLFLQLSKQQLIFGPMQIEARINQDQNIAKDLSLWNQQGSQVLQGQTLVLPMDDNFIYIKPIYIQASQARMPQLKKIAMVVGNTLIYTDTYEQALAELAGVRSPPPAVPPAGTTAPHPTSAAPPAVSTTSDQRVEEIRRHLRRYRELAGQGKWAEAGKELEALEAAVKP